MKWINVSSKWLELRHTKIQDYYFLCFVAFFQIYFAGRRGLVVNWGVVCSNPLLQDYFFCTIHLDQSTKQKPFWKFQPAWVCCIGCNPSKRMADGLWVCFVYKNQLHNLEWNKGWQSYCICSTEKGENKIKLFFRYFDSNLSNF